jgi:Protein of unknown function (DUF1566)
LLTHSSTRALWIASLALGLVDCTTVLGDFAIEAGDASVGPGSDDASPGVDRDATPHTPDGSSDSTAARPPDAAFDSTTDTGIVVTARETGVGDDETAGCNEGLAACGGRCVSLADIHSCGSCDNDCTLLPYVGPTGFDCVSGKCIYACAAGHADCHDAGIGCTVTLGTTSDCASCGASCSGATPVCQATAGLGYACGDSCAAGETACGGACTSLATDPNNCGACGHACNIPDAVASCGGSSCVIASCAPGYADCDKLASTGCEVNTAADVNNCGACGIPCAPANGTGACHASSCVVASCTAGFADCDHLGSTGCEIDTNGDANNCGACGHACAPAQICSSGTCLCPASTPTFCSASGACVNTTNDNANCATCGNACPTGQICKGSACGAHWADSYDDSYCTDDSTTPLTCPTSPGQPGWGEDGAVHINPPVYSLTATIVSDRVTGLTWERVLANGATTNFAQAAAAAHCTGINAITYGGFTDWRLPTAREVSTIDDMGQASVSPHALPGAVFQNLQMNSALWTQTPAATLPGAFWVLDLNWPVMEEVSGTTLWPAGVACVRGGPLSTLGYVVSASGDVALDRRTNLSWQRAFSPTPSAYLQALAYCTSLGLDGFADWRLPNYKELFSIVDTTKSAPAIDATTFPGTPSAMFWSSSAAPPSNTGGQAYSIDFTFGGGFNVVPTTNTYMARCVRGG